MPLPPLKLDKVEKTLDDLMPKATSGDYRTLAVETLRAILHVLIIIAFIQVRLYEKNLSAK